MRKTLFLTTILIGCSFYQHSQALENEYPAQAAREQKEQKAAPSPQAPREQRAAPPPREQRAVQAPREERAIRAPREERAVRAPREERAIQAPREERAVRAPREERAVRAPREERAVRAPREERAVRAPREERAVQAPREERAVRAPREERDIRAPRERRDNQTSRERRDVRAPGERRGVQQVVDPANLERRGVGDRFDRNRLTDPRLRQWHARDRSYLYAKRSARTGHRKFGFTPQRHSNYRVWIDAYPVDYIELEYTISDLIVMESSIQEVGYVVNDTVTIQGMTFELVFDTPLRAGRESVARIFVSKYGEPFTKLEPVMGEFAHIVTFNEDRSTFSYIRPMGREPSDQYDSGGPELLFGLEPNRRGYIKFFVQVRVRGEDIFAPFGVMVE